MGISILPGNAARLSSLTGGIDIPDVLGVYGSGKKDKEGSYEEENVAHGLEILNGPFTKLLKFGKRTGLLNNAVIFWK
jgi:hypothetical protein